MEKSKSLQVLTFKKISAPISRGEKVKGKKQATKKRRKGKRDLDRQSLPSKYLQLIQ
jgi:hypothetical protein